MRPIETGKHNFRIIDEDLAKHLPSQMRGWSGEIVAIHDDRFHIGDAIFGFYHYRARTRAGFVRFSSKELLKVGDRLTLDMFNVLHRPGFIPMIAVDCVELR